MMKSPQYFVETIEYLIYSYKQLIKELLNLLKKTNLNKMKPQPTTHIPPAPPTRSYCRLSRIAGIANENGGITFFPVQVNVGAQPQAVSGPMQPLSAQALAGTLNTPMAGATLQLPGQLTVQQISPGEQRPSQPLATAARPRKMGSLSLFFRKVLLRPTCAWLGVSL